MYSVRESEISSVQVTTEVIMNEKTNKKAGKQSIVKSPETAKQTKQENPQKPPKPIFKGHPVIAAIISLSPSILSRLPISKRSFPVCV